MPQLNSDLWLQTPVGANCITDEHAPPSRSLLSLMCALGAVHAEEEEAPCPSELRCKSRWIRPGQEKPDSPIHKPLIGFPKGKETLVPHICHPHRGSDPAPSPTSAMLGTTLPTPVSVTAGSVPFTVYQITLGLLTKSKESTFSKFVF